jgi:hypothetical protein
MAGFLFAASIVLAPFSSTAASFSDGFFDDLDWSLTVLAYRDLVLDATAGSSSAVQEATGGNPTHFRRTDIAINPSGTPGNLVVSVSFQNAAIHDPQTQGAVSSVDFQLDARGVEFSHVMGFAVRQGGNIYLVLLSSGFFFPDSNWQSYQLLGLTESDFGLCGDRFPPLCTGSGTPDFSDSGTPLEFGYYLASSSSESIAGSTQVDTDNWIVTVDAVPRVPTLARPGLVTLTVLLLATAILGGAWFGDLRQRA